MKKTFLAMVVTGASLVMFAQTNPATPVKPTLPATPAATTMNPTSTMPTTQPATTTPALRPATNTGVTNSTSDPLQTTTNQQINTNTNTNTNNSSWNNSSNGAVNANPSTGALNTSASWAPGTSPSWGWNSYGIWNNNTSPSTSPAISNTTAAGKSISGTDVNAGNTASNNSYAAYGTAVNTLPMYVQTNFGKDFPNTTNAQYKWNQYGDWFNTYYTSNGRLTQYFYNERGSGYSLSLPVVQTYVPDDIIDKALQKYGANLYSISMIKTAEGKSAYQLGILDRGQYHSDYLNEDGTTVASVWRTEEINMSSTSANAAMDSQTTKPLVTSSAVSADQDTTKPKMKTKLKNGKMKMKTKGHKQTVDSTSTSSGMKEQ